MREHRTMKTAEEAAKERAGCKGLINECPTCESRRDCKWLRTYEDFLAGVEWANSWISVEDELPEVNVSILILSKDGFYLGSKVDDTDWIAEGIMFTHNKDISKNEDIPLVTHWRYINTK